MSEGIKTEFLGFFFFFWFLVFSFFFLSLSFWRGDLSRWIEVWKLGVGSHGGGGVTYRGRGRGGTFHVWGVEYDV